MSECCVKNFIHLQIQGHTYKVFTFDVIRTRERESLGVSMLAYSSSECHIQRGSLARGVVME